MVGTHRRRRVREFADSDGTHFTAMDICTKCWRMLSRDDDSIPCDAHVAVPITEIPFEIIVQEAWNRLPRDVHKALKVAGVGVVTDDESHEGAAGLPRGRAFAIYNGQTKTIHIYQKACETNLDMPISERVFRVLWHEVGHALGLDHDAIRAYDL